MNKVNYTNWLIELIDIILSDNKDMSASEISLNEDELRTHYINKLEPMDVYVNIWEKDAGNYYKIPF